MINLFKKKNYINNLISLFNAMGYEQFESNESEIIPKELYRKCKFSVIEMYNKKVNKTIQLYITSLLTIHKIQLLDLNHNEPHNQYNLTTLSLDIRILSCNDSNYLNYGFKSFGREQFDATKILLDNIREYLQTKKQIPEYVNSKFPKDRKEIKLCLNSILLPLGFEILFDYTLYNPYYSIPMLTYARNNLCLNFIRTASKDENFISFNYNYKSNKRHFVYIFGEYEPGRAFNKTELEQFKNIIKEKIHTTLDMT